jgi:flavodoxin
MSVLLVSPKDKGNTYDVLKYVEDKSYANLMVIGKTPGSYDLKDYETIIICSGVYGGDLHKDLQTWLKDLDKSSLNDNARIYAFLTWIGRGKSDKQTLDKIGNILEKKGISLEEDYMTCLGKMAIIRRSHPDDQDRKRVLEWVKTKE